MMGTVGAYPGGGIMGLEQFVSYDGNDMDSMKAAWNHMDDAVKDAVSIGYPPGKEFLYLQIGWTDEQIWDALAHAKQPQAFHYQRQIKEAFDPNNVGDRMYPTLPEGYEPGN